MYHESVFSMRQESTKLTNVPTVSRYFHEETGQARTQNGQVSSWFVSVLSHLLLGKRAQLSCGLRHMDYDVRWTPQPSKGYGSALIALSCPIDPIDAGAEFHEDSLGDRPRFAYAYRKYTVSYWTLVAAYWLSLGTLWLLFHWFPLWPFLLTHRPCRLVDATHVVIYTQRGEEHVASVFRANVTPSEAERFDNWPPLCASCCRVLESSAHRSTHASSVLSVSSERKVDRRDDGVEKARSSSTEDVISEPHSLESSFFSSVNQTLCRCAAHRQPEKAAEDHTGAHLLMFQFRLVRYYLNLRENAFNVVHFDSQLPPSTLHAVLGGGIPTRAVYESRKRIFGTTDSLAYSLWKMIFKEMTEPFYLFQLLSVALWIWDDYTEYAYVVLVLMVASSCYDIWTARSCEQRVLRLGLDATVLIRVFRDWTEHWSLSAEAPRGAQLYENEFLLAQGLTHVPAHDVQPGDVFQLEEGMVMPCDAVLLWGSAIVSEVVLSGESVPQTKTALPGSDVLASNSKSSHPGKRRDSGVPESHHTAGTSSRSMGTGSVGTTTSYTTLSGENVVTSFKIDQDTHCSLYASTKVLKLLPPPKGHRVLALCLRTRFLSCHGRLMRSLLFPNSPHFDFNAHALRFLAWLFYFCLFGVVLSGFTGRLYRFGLKVTFIRSMDLFTDAIPPALPAVLSMGIVVAIKRLRSEFHVNCINAGRVNLAGQVDTFVFDKTGTLTEQGLEFGGCFEVENVSFPDFAPTRGRRNASTRLDVFFPTRRRPVPHTGSAVSLKGKAGKPAVAAASRRVTDAETAKGSSMTAYDPHYARQRRKLARFGPCRFDPTKLARRFIEAIATCHSISLIGNRPAGDPLELRMLDFVGWTVHEIASETDEVVYGPLSGAEGPQGPTALTRTAALEAATQAVITLYDSGDHVPIIMKPPGVTLSLLQQQRRGAFTHPRCVGRVSGGLQRRSCDMRSVPHGPAGWGPPTTGAPPSGSPVAPDATASGSSCQLEETSRSSEMMSLHELGILRRFEFSSALQRISVVVRNPLTQELFAFCKGSAEALADLCTSASLPATFHTSVAQHTQRGARVIVVAGKPLGRLSGRAVTTLTRTEVETKLTLLGCVVFTNRLKPDTKKAVKELREAHCRCIIATGDNPLTALAVAKSCGIVRDIRYSRKEVILGDLYVPRTHLAESRVGQRSYFVWTKIERQPTHDAPHPSPFTLPSNFTHDQARSGAAKDCSSAAEDAQHQRTILLQRMLVAHNRKLITLDLRDFLRGRSPRDFEFVLTGRAFRKLRMLHEELQLPWFGHQQYTANPNHFRHNRPPSHTLFDHGPSFWNPYPAVPRSPTRLPDPHQEKPEPSLPLLSFPGASHPSCPPSAVVSGLRLPSNKANSPCRQDPDHLRLFVGDDSPASFSRVSSLASSNQSVDSASRFSRNVYRKLTRMHPHDDAPKNHAATLVGRFRLERYDHAVASSIIFGLPPTLFPLPATPSRGVAKLKPRHGAGIPFASLPPALHPVSFSSERSSWASVSSFNKGLRVAHRKDRLPFIRSWWQNTASSAKKDLTARRKTRPPGAEAAPPAPTRFIELPTRQRPLFASQRLGDTRIYSPFAVVHGVSLKKRLGGTYHGTLTTHQGANLPCRPLQHRWRGKTRRLQHQPKPVSDWRQNATEQQHQVQPPIIPPSTPAASLCNDRDVLWLLGTSPTHHNASHLCGLRICARLEAYRNRSTVARSAPGYSVATNLRQTWRRMRSDAPLSTDSDSSEEPTVVQDSKFQPIHSLYDYGAGPTEAVRIEGATASSSVPAHVSTTPLLTSLFGYSAAVPSAVPLPPNGSPAERPGPAQRFNAIHLCSLKESLLPSIMPSSSKPQCPAPAERLERGPYHAPRVARSPPPSASAALAQPAQQQPATSTGRARFTLHLSEVSYAESLAVHHAASSLHFHPGFAFPTRSSYSGPPYPQQPGLWQIADALVHSPGRTTGKHFDSAAVPGILNPSPSIVPHDAPGCPPLRTAYTSSPVDASSRHKPDNVPPVFSTTSRLAHKGLIPATNDQLMLLTVVLVKPRPPRPQASPRTTQAPLLPSPRRIWYGPSVCSSASLRPCQKREPFFLAGPSTVCSSVVSTEEIRPLSVPAPTPGPSHQAPWFTDATDVDFELVRMSLFEYLLRNTRIYSRMLPEDKTSLLTALRSLPGSPAIGMCGDSANDCGALRAADVGVSLNDATASVAAPFISHRQSIQSCVDILREGRASLSNAMHMFKFVVFYSIVQYSSVVLLYCYGLNYTDNQYMMVDFAIIIPLSFFVSETEPSPKLKPSLPNARLLSKSFALTILLHSTVATFWMAVLLVMIRFTPGWRPFRPTPVAGDSSGAEIASYENTALFYFTNFQYLILCFVSMSHGRRWRKKLYTNVRLVLWSLFLCLLFLGLVLVPRPGTIPRPTAHNLSPAPYPVPPISKTGLLAHIMILLDQWLVVVALPGAAKLLILVLVILHLITAAAIYLFFSQPWIYEEQKELKSYRSSYRGPIPHFTRKNGIMAYHVL